MKEIKILLLWSLILFSSSTYSMPAHLEVWFLSVDKVSEVLRLINDEPHVLTLTAQANQDCIPMGDGCFNPQYGFIPSATEKPTRIESNEVELKTINAIETDLIKCDSNNMFDIFCGKTAPKKTSKVSLEVWIDTSSSLRAIDSASETTCERSVFVKNVATLCGSKVVFSIFNTSLKELGDSSAACLNYGMNDVNNLKEWIDSSKSNNLIVITDIDEYSLDLDAFITKNNGIMRGVGVTPLSAKELLGLGKQLKKYCQ